MNPICELEREIKLRFPEVRTVVEFDPRPDCRSFVDIYWGDYSIVVALVPNFGFGLSAIMDEDLKEIGIDNGFDECYSDLESTTQRVLTLLVTKRRTYPPYDARRDHSLNEVKSAVNAMGGKLVMKVQFPDGGERELDLADLNRRKNEPAIA